MLWKYAPAADMVGDRPVDGLHGAGGRHLQMGRRRRSGSLLRSILAGRRKDRYVGVLGSHGSGSAQRNDAQRAASAGCTGRTQLHRILDHRTGAGSDLFRRRCRGGALESQSLASAQSSNQLAFERQAAGFSVERSLVCSAASGSRYAMRWPRPSPISKRANHRPATASPSSCVSPRRWRRSRHCTSSLQRTATGRPACRLSSKSTR